MTRDSNINLFDIVVCENILSHVALIYFKVRAYMMQNYSRNGSHDLKHFHSERLNVKYIGNRIA